METRLAPKLEEAGNLLLDRTWRTLLALSNEMNVKIKEQMRCYKKLDDRLRRMHLILEEAGELAKSLEQRDELAVLDALTDLNYVVEGTGVTYDLPLDEAFLEVHRSNMTKNTSSGENGIRLRDKGPDYIAPDLRTVLEKYRRSQCERP